MVPITITAAVKRISKVAAMGPVGAGGCRSETMGDSVRERGPFTVFNVRDVGAGGDRARVR